jgi:cyclopropane fatty-acyl-phospholipid synthase-like methyltransferase
MDSDTTKAPLYILAPYVPTPPEIVQRMLQLAQVQPHDIVFDLGCGDGRLVIAAARDCGAQGVGVDIEPYWVEQSQANAELAGVSHRTHFMHQDALTVDLTSASVVFLYLVHWSTQRTMAYVRSQVAPGTRVLSHNFAIETLPDVSTEHLVDNTGQTHTLHLWVA